MTIEQKIPQAVPVTQGAVTNGITQINNRFDRVESAAFGWVLYPVDSTTETMTSAQFWEAAYIQVSAGTPAPGGAVTINVPAEERGIFTIYNNCGESVTVQISGQSATPPTIGNGDLGTLISDGINVRTAVGGSGSPATVPFRLTVALSSESEVLTTGAAKVTLRQSGDVRLSDVRISLSGASDSGPVQVDMNVNGSTILSTKLTIDPTEKSSVDAATPYVFDSPPVDIDDDDEITFDVDLAGANAIGLKAYMIGTYR